MHLSLILMVVVVGCCVRLFSVQDNATWQSRWQQSLGLFLFSPLLLLITAIAILGMGREGQMLGLPAGEIGFACACVFLTVALGFLLTRTVQVWCACRQIRRYEAIEIANVTAYRLETALPFAAQVGFWQSRLILSQGLFVQFPADQVQAILTHEQAHAYYRDTFWFFWLGWLRQITAWLPNTERCWQDLLLLREMRADRWAAQRVDALLIAEALLQMARAPLTDLENGCGVIGASASLTRIEERIEALLAEPEPEAQPRLLPWIWLLTTLVPLLTVVLHQ